MFTFTTRAINPGAGPAYRTFKVLAADRFSTSEPPPAQLVRNFNQTLNRLEETFGTLSPFSSEIAHEPRTHQVPNGSGVNPGRVGGPYRVLPRRLRGLSWRIDSLLFSRERNIPKPRSGESISKWSARNPLSRPRLISFRYCAAWWTDVDQSCGIELSVTSYPTKSAFDLPKRFSEISPTTSSFQTETAA
jgi:hypothetical protein